MTETPSYHHCFDAEVKNRFNNDVRNHTVKVICNKGFTRHWLCKGIGEVHWFEVITWRGGLCINGDMGTYTFTRTNDMIAFMRSAAMSYSYAAEKCRAADRDGIKEFREECFIESIDYEIEIANDDDNTERVTKLRVLKQEVAEWAEGNEHETYQKMHESGLFDCEMPSCRSYTLRFLWNLHAIKWLCDQVKDHKPSHLKTLWHRVKGLPRMIDYAGK